MQKVAAYFRVSSDEQRDKQTIQNQIEFANKYADLHQIKISEQYLDDGVTGTVSLETRSAGAKLLSDAKAGKIDTVLIYKLDRLGRSARIILNAIHELENLGVKIKSMTEPFDTTDASGRFLLTILAGVADLERGTFLERSALGIERMAREGKWIGGIVPYGYRVNAEKYLEVNEDLIPGFPVSEADIVRKIFMLMADEKYTTEKLADYLNACGYPPRYVRDGRKVIKGKRKENTSGFWRPSRIRNMIINTTYKGIHTYGKRSTKQRELITRPVPLIVPEELWERANAKLKANRIESTKNTKGEYLLRGLIKCGECDLTYSGTFFSGKGRKYTTYYVCLGKNTKYRGDFIGRCKSKNVPGKWIEDIVWDDCVKFINNPGDAIEKIAKKLEEETPDTTQLLVERDTLTKRLGTMDDERDKVVSLHRKDFISEAEAEKHLTEIANDKQTLKNRIEEISYLLDSVVTFDKKLDAIEETLIDLKVRLSGKLTFEDRRDIVKKLVKKITVYTDQGDNGKPEARLKVMYLFADSVVSNGTGSLHSQE